MNKLELAQEEYIIWMGERLNQCEAFLHVQSGWGGWTDEVVKEGKQHRENIEKLKL